MKILPISRNSFQGLYKIDRKYLGENTKLFLQSNNEVISVNEPPNTDTYVLTPKNKDKEFEESIKKDNGRYWKSRPLSDLMLYPILLETIYHANAVRNNYKEDWVDFTENWQTDGKIEEDNQTLF